MFSSTVFISLVLVASSIARPTLPLARRQTGDVRLSDWASHSPPLESYWRFKNRFAALGCASHQGTDFYTSCCYPLEATQSLSDRPAECTPASTSCGASVQAVTPSSSSSSAAPAYTDSNTGGNTDNEDDDENLPICEDPNDDGEWHDDDDTYTYSSEPAATTSSYSPDPTPSETPQQSTPDTNNNNNSGNTGNTGSSGNNGGTTGETYTDAYATFFWQGGNPGACGNYHGDNDLIAALDTRMYGTDYSQPSSWCGRTVRVTNTQNGKTVDVMIQDACPSCNTPTSLDLSHGAFLAIADFEGQGILPITWTPLY